MDVDHCCVIPWKEHLKTTFKPLMEGYWAGVENGSFEYGGYCLMNYTKHSLYAGQPLDEMEKEI
ncbi:hypothetical protein [Sporomusa ovata]|uniref:hypothetical protein n=1 Tax=Sporomusa ovata TaxID=2378 RepID=UPI001C6FCB26|nr:hypothetical protein [Sporomusa ovata]